MSAPHSHRRLFLPTLLACLSPQGSALALQASPSALPALPTQPLPGATNDGDFELASVAVNASVEAPVYGDWDFGAGTGIAGEDSALASPNGAAPSGDRVAYLVGNASFEVTATLATGTYRLHYDLARRVESPPSSAEHYVRISLGRTVVAEDEDVTELYASFVTKPFAVTSAGVKTIVFRGIGDPTRTALIDDVRIEPLRNWGDTGTWSTSQVPTASDDVTIPSGSVVAISGERDAATVEIQGELVVPNEDGSLTAELVRVSGSGARFEMGRRRAPYKQRFTVHLSGDYMTSPPATHKALIATNEGELDFHGKPKTSWSKLLPTYLVTSNYIVVEDTTGWEVGDQIVIAGSRGQQADEMNYQDYAEVRSILAFQTVTIPFSGGATEDRVILGEADDPLTGDPLDYTHHTGPALSRNVHGQVLSLDQRAEVGMLSHNIVVRGTVAPNEGLGLYGEHAGFGGHVMVSTTGTGPAGGARFSSVELTRLGRSRELGRYPFHWHMNRDEGAGQYIESCSIHETFNRAITIHGTDEARAEDNVCYDNLGHAVFLEDGSEMDNVIRKNLVLSTQRPDPGDETIPTDNHPGSNFQSRSPSSFWITNPNNVIEDNVAAGTFGSGFWLIFSTSVHGLSKGNTPGIPGHHAGVNPSMQDLRSFKGNVAHGCSLGFDVHDGVSPSGELLQNVPWLPPSAPALIEDMSVYACDEALYTGVSPGLVTFLRARLADNISSIVFAGYDEVHTSMLIADTGNNLLPFGVSVEGYRLYDGAGRMTDDYVEGFTGPGRNFLDFSRASKRHPNHRFTNLDTASVPQNIEWFDFGCWFDSNPDNCPPMGNNPPMGCDAAPVEAPNPLDIECCGLIVRDVDGTLTGSGIPCTVIADVPLLEIGNETSYPASTHALISTSRFGLIRPAFPTTNLTYPGQIVGCRITRVHAPPSPAMPLPDVVYCGRGKGSTTFQQIPTIIGEDFYYTLELDQPLSLPQQGTDEIYLIFEDYQSLDAMRLDILGVGAMPGFSESQLIVEATGGATSAASVAQLEGLSSTGWYYDSGTGTLHVRVVKVNGVFDGQGQIKINKQDDVHVNWD